MMIRGQTAHWWRNCAGVPDAETETLDRIEHQLDSVPEHVWRTRELIAMLEMCHHKAQRWVEHIVDAIGTERPEGGLGSRTEGQHHPIENMWQAACDVLSAWCEGRLDGVRELAVVEKSSAELISALSSRTELKQWQVRRVEARIRSFIGWPHAEHIQGIPYVPLMETGSGYTSVLRTDCPPEYSDQEALWQRTVQTIVHDQRPKEPEDGLLHLASPNLSLAVAIDMLMPCNWNFAENLHTLLAAIGGQTELRAPFAACGRHIRRAPVRAGMIDLCRALHAYGTHVENSPATQEVGLRLGSVTPARSWLVASLAKTIRLQLDISDAEVRRR